MTTRRGFIYQVTGWALLTLAGAIVLTGCAWAAPAVVFLSVSGMSVLNLREWIDAARWAGHGWPRR